LDLTVRFCFRSPSATAVTTLNDAAHLFSQVRAHDVDGIGQVLPGAGDAGHLRLAAELALGADLAGDRASPRRRIAFS